MTRKFLYFLIYFLFLLSMKLWIGWEDREKYIVLMIAPLLVVILNLCRVRLDFSFQNVGMCLAIFMAYLLTGTLGISASVQLFLFVIVICLNDFDKVRCLSFITKWFGYLMIPSVIIYGLYQLGDLPHFGIQRANLNNWAIAKGYGVCENYLFYMRGIKSSAFRFNGPFLEPGHLGMITAFLLFVNKFDFRQKGMWMILTALVLTFSLAGYILTFIAFYMTLHYKGEIRLRTLLLWSVFFGGIYLLALYYNNGDNLFNEKILARLEYDEEKGIAGNNRVFGLIKAYYAAMWNNSHTLLWGYPKETMEWLANNRNSRGTGVIMWMCQYGIIGTAAVAFIYVFYYFRSKARRFAGLCLIFVILMFWQRSYPFWTSWIICYVYGIVAEENRLMKENYENRHSYISS